MVPQTYINKPKPISQIQFLEINMKYIVVNMPKIPSAEHRIAKKAVKCFLSMLSWK